MEENENMEEEMMETSANANETKADKFKRLAEFRVNKLMGQIASIEKLSSRSSYEYTEEQVEMMFGTIEEELRNAKAHFQATKAKENKFHF